MLPNLGIGWSLSGTSGWGVYGMNLVSELFRRGGPTPILLGGAAADSLPANFRAKLEPYLEQGIDLNERVAAMGGKKAQLKDTCILHSLGNGLRWGDVTEKFEGDVDIGVVFFEEGTLDAKAVAHGNMFDAVIAGSTWNADVMREAGIHNVHRVLQGVDTKLFGPMTIKPQFGNRFIVFSGGKLEFRKGQDIALAAFKIFNARHPDSVLMTAWQNQWHTTVGDLSAAGHTVPVPPPGADGRTPIVAWAAANGVPSDSVIDLGLLPNIYLPQLLNEASVGLFLSRAEGGTNLAAMETMACGVPCILSANTGHLDLIDGENGYPITEQGRIASPGDIARGWGESPVDAVVDALEKAYTDSADRRRRGLRAAAFMREWSWQNQVGKLLTVIDKIGG